MQKKERKLTGFLPFSKYDEKIIFGIKVTLIALPTTIFTKINAVQMKNKYPIHMSNAFTLSTCPIDLPCPHVQYIYPVHMSNTFALSTCPVLVGQKLTGFLHRNQNFDAKNLIMMPKARRLLAQMYWTCGQGKRIGRRQDKRLGHVDRVNVLDKWTG